MKNGYKLLLIAACFLVVGHVEYREKQDEQKAEEESQKALTAREQKIAEFFIKEKSPDPVGMAQAVATSKRPRLMAAVAAVESNGSPKAKGKRGERGAFQVRPDIHGAVPVAPKEQAEQAEKILEELVSESNGNLREAVRKYNGSGRDARIYASKVMRKVNEVKL